MRVNLAIDFYVDPEIVYVVQYLALVGRFITATVTMRGLMLQPTTLKRGVDLLLVDLRRWPKKDSVQSSYYELIMSCVLGRDSTVSNERSSYLFLP